jgi:hypothetical protein
VKNEFERNLIDEARDEFYGELLFQIHSKNKSRLESIAKELIAKKNLSIEVEGFEVHYKLKFRSLEIKAYSKTSKLPVRESLSRMGWRKADKLKELPLMFAGMEASLLIKE